MAWAAPPPRGYQARSCGYDLDFDGVAGETSDCAHLCRGGAGDVDVDGNGVADRTVYVDCSVGVDDASCGSASAPCRTIQWALDGDNTTFSHRLRSPGAEQIQAVCFRGTCAGATVVPSWSGAPGISSRPARGSEARAFELPRYPLVISGWDADGDGVFPPADEDDLALLDGEGSTAMAVRNDQLRSRFEIAHFSARDYGGCSGTAGFFYPAPSWGSTVTHTYLHDLELARINVGCPGLGASGIVVFQMWAPGGESYNWGAFVNIEIRDYAVYLARGSGGSGESGPFRFQGLTAVQKGAGGDTVRGFKLWELYSGIEVLDSVFDGNPRAWSPDRTAAVVAAQCSRDWVVRNNEFIDLWRPIHVQGNGDALVCELRNVDDVVIDGNVVRNSYEAYAWGDMDVLVGAAPGTSSTGTIEDVTITNNFLSSTTGREAAIQVQVGHDGGGAAPGRIVIANNTLDGGYNRTAAIALLAAGESRQQRFEIRNNLLSNVGSGDLLILTEYAPAGFQSDYNVFDPAGVWSWSSVRHESLSSWRDATLADANSRQCVPAFIDRARGDFHLQPTDLCAVDQGMLLSSFDHDIDGDRRDREWGWDIGADEVVRALFADGFESGDTSGWSTVAN